MIEQFDRLNRIVTPDFARCSKLIQAKQYSICTIFLKNSIIKIINVGIYVETQYLYFLTLMNVVVFQFLRCILCNSEKMQSIVAHVAFCFHTSLNIKSIVIKRQLLTSAKLFLHMALIKSASELCLHQTTFLSIKHLAD